MPFIGISQISQNDFQNALIGTDNRCINEQLAKRQLRKT
jgi:hypothetical protein